MTDRETTTDDRAALLRTRLALSAFGLAALVLIVAAVWLPPYMRERAVEACAASGGTYDRTQALCVRA